MDDVKHAAKHHCYGKFHFGNLYIERDCFTCPVNSDCMSATHYNSYVLSTKLETSDGSTASYYTLPDGARELQDLISYRDMNAQVGEIFRACYRYGQVAHSPKLRDMRKIMFYAEAEIARLVKLEEVADAGAAREKSHRTEAAEPATNSHDHSNGKVYYD